MTLNERRLFLHIARAYAEKLDDEGEYDFEGLRRAIIEVEIELHRDEAAARRQQRTGEQVT